MCYGVVTTNLEGLLTSGICYMVDCIVFIFGKHTKQSLKVFHEKPFAPASLLAASGLVCLCLPTYSLLCRLIALYFLLIRAIKVGAIVCYSRLSTYQSNKVLS